MKKSRKVKSIVCRFNAYWLQASGYYGLYASYLGDSYDVVTIKISMWRLASPEGTRGSRNWDGSPCALVEKQEGKSVVACEKKREGKKKRGAFRRMKSSPAEIDDQFTTQHGPHRSHKACSNGWPESWENYVKFMIIISCLSSILRMGIETSI